MTNDIVDILPEPTPPVRDYGELVPPEELFARIEASAKRPLGTSFAQCYGALQEHYERAYRTAMRKQ